MSDGAAIIARSRLLGDYFETDLQSYQPALDAITEALRHAHAGHASKPIHGNVYTLTLDRDGAKITNARDRKIAPEHLSLDDFAAALASWTTPKTP